MSGDQLSEHTYTIGGVKIVFPVKAYPSQLSMMDKVIRGCHRAQNCLLESPTGSGKTLALLCSALSWQQAEAARLAKLAEEDAKEQMRILEEKLQQEELRKQKMATQKNSDAAATEENGEDSDKEEASWFKPKIKKQKITTPSKLIDPMSENLVEKNAVGCGDCGYIESRSEGPKSDFPSSKVVGTPSKIAKISENSPLKLIIKKKFSDCDCCDPAEELENNPEGCRVKKFKPPKIYFGTRTHKQIAQVTKELRRISCASNIRICTLASRNHTCIHPRCDLFPNMNKTEYCQQLLDPHLGSGCKFHEKSKRINCHQVLESMSFPKIWDIEDLVTFGKKQSLCPYFTARNITSTADIIFCPYNYLIDPLIRKSMDINLKGEIVILDEAHNIEDTCRESASFALHQPDLLKAINDCEKIAERRHLDVVASSFRFMTKFLKSIDKWISANSGYTKNTDYDQGVITFSGYEAIESFENSDFGPSAYKEFQEHLPNLYSDKQSEDMGGGNGKPDDERSAEEQNISGSTKKILESLLLILGFLYNDNFTNDYQVALTKLLITGTDPSQLVAKEELGGWLRIKKKPTKQENYWRLTLNLWCLNPATVFSDIKDKARSVILTSGTLSPIDSFQSELGAEFPIRLEANHIIDQSQCWVGSLGVGPNNIALNGVFSSTSTYEFQDELGHLVFKICSFVPHGVLLFLSSYHLLEKLHDRWECTGILESIRRHKKVLCEPRRADQFEELMHDFYQSIGTYSGGRIGQDVTGVLFLAVCRGKVSEGLDFADNNARIVITVGIPFPNVKDPQVTLKKTYNNKYKPIKGLLSGNDWYQIQAFRALNQALGRCIRHRRDWGAILLVDGRFTNEKYCSSLSKWVRNKKKHHFTWESMAQNLASFIEYRLSLNET